jgi:hypothetical protein
MRPRCPDTISPPAAVRGGEEDDTSSGEFPAVSMLQARPARRFDHF